MSTTYETVAGDTFDLISRKVYGLETEAGRIRSANTGVLEPIEAGLVLVIPPLPDALTDQAQPSPSAAVNEVAISIEGERFRFWESARIVRAIDAIDIVEFGGPFEPDNEKFRQTFEPFTYKDMSVTVGGDRLFTGTIVGVDPSLQADANRITVSGYARPGVLADCNAPAGDFPLEYNGQGLKGIAEQLAAPFGIGVKFEADQGAPFNSVSLEPTERILSFLEGLAKQRNLVLSNDIDGNLVFVQSVEIGRPVANLAQGAPPVVSIVPFFSPQDYYSAITGIEQVIVGFLGSQFPVQNELLTGVLRPHSFNVTDTLSGEASDVVNAKVGRMFANMASYELSVATWRDPDGALWEPNTTIKIHAPRVMIYDPFEFIIRKVEFKRDQRSEIASLNLVLPGAFAGKQPESLPWQDG